MAISHSFNKKIQYYYAYKTSICFHIYTANSFKEKDCQIFQIAKFYNRNKICQFQESNLRLGAGIIKLLRW